MKRFIIIALMALTAVSAQLSAKESKEAKNAAKAAKETVKALRKDGFRPIEYGDGTTTLERYFVKVNEGCQGFVGTADDCISINLAKISAQTNIANEYALSTGGRLRGRVTNSVSRLGGEQLDDIVAAYERLINFIIKGELHTCATFIKTDKNGRFSARIFCIVDSDAAHQARLIAMQRSLEETNLAEAYGSMVSEWIDEGMMKIDD